jgi:hypothetical protein
VNQRKYWEILINIDLYSGGDLTKRVHAMKNSGSTPMAIALDLGITRSAVRYRLKQKVPDAIEPVVFTLVLNGS